MDRKKTTQYIFCKGIYCPSLWLNVYHPKAQYLLHLLQKQILNVHNGHLVRIKWIQGDVRCTFWFLPCQHWNDKFAILCHSLSFFVILCHSCFANLCHTLFDMNSQKFLSKSFPSSLRTLSTCLLLRVRIIITRASELLLLVWWLFRWICYTVSDILINLWIY